MSENDNLHNADGKQNDDTSKKALNTSESADVNESSEATTNEEVTQQKQEEPVSSENAQAIHCFNQPLPKKIVPV